MWYYDSARVCKGYNSFDDELTLSSKDYGIWIDYVSTVVL